MTTPRRAFPWTVFLPLATTLLVGALSFAAAWAVFGFRVEQQEKRTEAIVEALTTIDAHLEAIDLQLVLLGVEPGALKTSGEKGGSPHVEVLGERGERTREAAAKAARQAEPAE